MTVSAEAPTPLNPSPKIFHNRNFLKMWATLVLQSTGVLIESVTLGWQVYAIARLSHSIEQSALLVGMIGLVQFLPMFGLTLLAGESADRYDRRKIILCCLAVKITCAIALTVLALRPAPSLVPIYIIAFFFGISRAFITPAGSAIMPMLVGRAMLPKAIAWRTLAMQGGQIIGPWLGGLLCAISPALSYGFACCLYITCTILALSLHANTQPEAKEGSRLLLIREGIHYVWRNKIVFGAISLDLAAVLLGGVTALLPVFARDVLHLGADGFGILRSGAAIGGIGMAAYLSRRPLQRHAGLWMFSAVGIFGVAALAFAFSKSLIFSIIALAVLGAADTVSVFVRQSLIQLTTPDALRGRVSAVSSLFISASNELGEFETGVVARLLGPVGAAAFGGIGSIAVTGIWARLFPALRKADKLTDPHLK